MVILDLISSRSEVKREVDRGARPVAVSYEAIADVEATTVLLPGHHEQVRVEAAATGGEMGSVGSAATSLTGCPPAILGA
jgi:hypothetical protein